jgi:hypothetical protein
MKIFRVATVASALLCGLGAQASAESFKLSAGEGVVFQEKNQKVFLYYSHAYTNARGRAVLGCVATFQLEHFNQITETIPLYSGVGRKISFPGGLLEINMWCQEGGIFSAEITTGPK